MAAPPPLPLPPAFLVIPPEIPLKSRDTTQREADRTTALVNSDLFLSVSSFFLVEQHIFMYRLTLNL